MSSPATDPTIEPSGAANNTNNDGSSSINKTVSIAILIGNNNTSDINAGSGKKSSSGSFNATTVPVVVWTLQERSVSTRTNSSGGNSNSEDLHKYNLVYYEFLDDTAKWTHLDQLLLQLVDVTERNDDVVDSGDDIEDPNASPSSSSSSWLPSIHIGTSDNLEKYLKKGKASTNSSIDDTMSTSQLSQTTTATTLAVTISKSYKLLQKLQLFLEGRLQLNADDNNNNNNNNLMITETIQQHLNVPVDSQKVEASLQRLLLLNNEETQLSVRGNLQLSQSLIRQGLALWLQSQGLYGNSSGVVLNYQMEGSLKVIKGQMTSHLMMDTTATQAIHLFPPINDGIATVVGGTMQNNSIYGILSQPCLTLGGKRLLKVWLRQPLVDLQKIQQRQNTVTKLMGIAKDSIREGLSCFSGNGPANVSRLGPTLAKYQTLAAEDNDETSVPNTTRIVDTKKPLETLYHLYILASRHLPHLLDCMECIKSDDNNETTTSTTPLLNALYMQMEQIVLELQRSVGLAEAVLDLDLAPQEFLVKAEYDEGLQEYHDILEQVQQAVQDERQTIQDAWDEISPCKGNKSTQVRIERVDDNMAWQFRLPDTNDSKLVESLGSKIYIHRILKNGVYFSSLELRQLSSKYQDIHAAYTRISKQIVQDAMNIAATYSNVVERAGEVISQLDVYCALAHTAAMSPHGYCRPVMTDSDEDGAGIILKGARHPCLELQEGIEFIPNDISLVFPNAQLLVSGPNMGGKSVYIRSLGAIVCMAQIGSYVPCTSATINICHAILARVGAGDLQERGISTFMAEMLESSAILRAATKRSLIIIDELGRGTSTFDGYGLARAILEYLMHRIGCMVVFATHFHELTNLSGVQNCHVTAQKGNQGLTFLYQVRPGPCLESFGIQVAELAHMPKAVIEDAKKRARELENFGQGQDVDRSKRPKLSKAKKMLIRLAQLDLPSILKESVDLSPEERRVKLLTLIE